MIQKFKNIRQFQNSDTVEPGLFQLFRTYIILADVIILINIVIMTVEGIAFANPAYYPGLAALAGINLLLFNKRLHKKHGPTILAACLGLYVLMSSSFIWGELSVNPPTEMFEWVQLYFRSGFTILFIPFIIAVWQFGLRGTVGYLTLAGVIEAAIFLLVFKDSTVIYGFGFIVFRTTSYFTVGFVISRLMMAQRRQRYELKMANQQLTHYATTLEQLSVSRERNRLARELHDTLAHTLSGVSVQLEAVRALWDPKPEDAKAMLNQALSDTRSGLTDTRRALEDLRAEPLEDLGLNLAIGQLCHAFNERTNIEVVLEVPEDLNPSAVVQNCIYRTVQEALTNIDRHAGAKNVQVRLAQPDNGRLALTITDDGIGFDPTSNPEAGHFGLRGMRERAEMIGGACEINSTPNEGTTINLNFKKEDA